MAKSPKKPPRPLKVFRTATGFHDAYVAAPSRAAALRAWGSDKDLFARGVAEEVTDPALTADALAAPGTVIRRLRGTAAEQMAALPPDRPKLAKLAPIERAAKPSDISSKTKPKPPPKPRPSRARLDAAEAAVADAETRHAAELADLVQREAALARERKATEKAQAGEARQLARARDDAADDFAAAMDRWRG